MKKATKIISFSSSKGGVGRTMTLTNCAKIYSEGRDWAGIESSITLLVDFDFHAPGIHYYDFLSEKQNKKYQVYNSTFSTYKDLQNELNQNNIGIAFFLSKIVNNNEYLKKCNQFLSFKETNSEKAIASFQNYVLNELFKKDDFNPLKHLIQIKSESLFILPAGSPNHHEYNDTVFKFDWKAFIEKQMGINLIDCIIYALVEHIKELPDFEMKPVRILLDQQAGISIAAAINRLLADSHILVGGFNEQNKAGLKAIVKNFYDAYEKEKKEPWVVLNQYNLRSIPFDYIFDIPDRNKNPHNRFRKEDEEQRVKFIADLTRLHPNLKEKIFVSEFVSEAVQKEHFHSSEKTSINELTKLIVSIEKSFMDKPKIEFHEPTLPKIIFIGERIEHKNDYSGPFASMYKLFKKHFSNSEIVGLAATHEDIVALANNDELKITIRESDKKISKTIQQLSEGIYNVTVDNESDTLLRTCDLDFVSYPYYVYQAFLKKESILKFSEKDFVRSYPVQDSLTGTSNSYYQKNIFRWSEYSVNNSDNSIIGVPLFFSFQLLAYRSDYFNKIQNLADEFRAKYHRQFKGFNDPDDLIKFADLTFPEGDDFKKVLLSSNPKNIAMWYEWQTIFSIFYHKNNQLQKNNSVENYKEFLLDDVSLDATLMYLRLRKGTESTDTSSYDWDELIKNFYLSKNNSLIFIWTDSIPTSDRDKTDFIYQVPPSFHLFEESWLFSITKKKEEATFTEEKIRFLNIYLTPEYQKEYVESGGLPVHKDLLTSLDIWRKYPFIPPLWSIYQNTDSQYRLTKRDSFTGIFDIGSSIAVTLDKAIKELDFTKNDTDLKGPLKKLIANNINNKQHGKE